MDFQEIVRDMTTSTELPESKESTNVARWRGRQRIFVPDEEGCRLLAVLPFLAPRRHAGRN